MELIKQSILDLSSFTLIHSRYRVRVRSFSRFSDKVRKDLRI